MPEPEQPRLEKDDSKSAVAATGDMKVDQTSLWTAIVVVVGFVAIIFGSFIQSWTKGMESLEIIPAIQTNDEGDVTVNGVVIYLARSQPGAEVWGIATDQDGNRFPLARVLTSNDGVFSLPLPDHFQTRVDDAAQAQPTQAVAVTLTATANITETVDGNPRKTEVSGRTILRPGVTTVESFRTRQVAPPWGLIVLLTCALACFLAALLVALVPGIDDRIRYFLCLAFAILLVLFMTSTLLRGMSFVAGRGSPGDLFNFGFAQIFYGSHSPEVPREWMFSFTTPQANDSTGVTGFYAPLWVMLMAVVGSSLMTLSLLVAEIVKPVREEEADIVRQRTQTIVMHQFFIQFAPLGAIFVYQSLLAAKAAEEPIAVALAALGAGAAMNLILRNAVNASARVFAATGKDEKPGDQGDRDSKNE